MGRRTDGLDVLNKVIKCALPIVLIYGSGVNDLLPLPSRPEEYGTIRDLITDYAKNYDYFVAYELASGFTFLDVEGELEFRKLVGFYLDEIPANPCDLEKISPEAREIARKRLPRWFPK